MTTLFGNLNILEALRVGLSGLLFLLSVLAFWLIRQEQDRKEDPRKGIIQTIYVFMTVNFLGAILVAFAGYIGPSLLPNKDQDSLGADTYIVDYTTFFVDLTKWNKATLGPVVITRTDYVRKVSDTKSDYIIPFFTTGDRIDYKPLTYSSQPKFIKKNDPDRKGINYDYVLPIGHQPKGHSEMVSTQFTFPTGFKNQNKEWWQARVAYPSKTIAVVFRFPSGKPVKNMSVSLKRGDEAAKPIDDNLVSVSDGGRIATWVGINQKGNHRVQFDWNW